MGRHIRSLMLAGSLIASLAAFAGCSQHNRYYDAGHGDYHSWNADEDQHYRQWENDTHREHQDFAKRSADEQKQYWDWRHHQ